MPVFVKWRHVGGVLWDALRGEPTHSLVVLIDKDITDGQETQASESEIDFARQVMAELELRGHNTQLP